MSIESEFEKEHIFQTLSYNQKVEASLTQASKTIGQTVSASKLKGSSYRYSKRFQRDINAAITTLRGTLTDGIETRMSDAWGLANLKNDAIEKAYLAGTNVIPNFGRINLGALDQFIKRAEGGLNLSARVFDVGTKVQDSLATYLSSGIVSGRSSVRIARDIGSLVKGGGVLYQGTLIKGAGNVTFQALRLAATETNSAYRMGDLARRKQLPFVRGIQVHLSGQHPRTDICNEMTGEYPKDFVFTGWHPLCICFSTAVMMTKKEFVRGLKKGNITAKNYINDIPPSAVNYIQGHSKAITKQRPYWYLNNFKLVSQKLLKESKKPPLKKKILPKGNQNLELDNAIPKKVESIDIKRRERGHRESIDDFAKQVDSIIKDAKEIGVILPRQKASDIAFSTARFTGGSYDIIREVQRLGSSKSTSKIIRYGNDIEEGIELLPNYNKSVLFRGQNYNHDRKEWNRFRKMEVGKIIDHGGTSSWSSELKVANKFGRSGVNNKIEDFGVVFKNTNKFRENTSINHLSSVSSESEVLVSKNKKFRVVDIKVTDIEKNILEITTEAVK